MFSLLPINLRVSSSSNFALNSSPYFVLSKSSKYFFIGNLAYLIRLAIPFSARLDSSFFSSVALAHSPTAVHSYVTWICKANTKDYNWGHYFTIEADARDDYAKRIRQEKSRFMPER
jgi:cellulose synthase/poly-beta-1,6-N-acetylglucosamine synthase-like glycosyltransferase